ncbi:hypothetical protein DSECCO2_597090 [anaerobic digester metagenome]
MQTPLYSKLNLLSNYAPVKNATVKVVDKQGNPLEGISVDYQVYNYSEFYTFASLKTGNDGRCSIETAFGDLMIWVTNGKGYTWKMFPFEQESELEIVFDPYAYSDSQCCFTFQIVPPILGKTVTPSTSKKEENDRRLKEEDSIRADYEAYFSDSATMVEYYKVSPFRNEIAGFIQKSRGNYMDIAQFFGLSRDQESAINLLSVISEKDLRDTPSDVLFDHLKSAEKFSCNNYPKDICTKYILSPRIGRELLSKWRSELQNSFSKKEIKSFRKDPENLVTWISNKIKLDTQNNYYGVTLFPGSVMKLRTADEYSRNVFFVACCRSFGIPARLEPATYIPQYYWQGEWISVFRSEATRDVEKVRLNINYMGFTPKYYTSYTIARLIDGRFQTLDYEYDESMNEFPVSIQLEPGLYRTMTGFRTPDGGVMTDWKYVNIPAGSDTVETVLILGGNPEYPKELFSFNNEFELSLLNKDSVIKKSELNSYRATSYNVIALIDPSTEPGKHFLNELSQSRTDFDTLKRNIFLVLPQTIQAASFDPKAWPGLPQNVVWLSDSKGQFAEQIKLETGKDLSYPEVLFISEGKVYYHFSGYHINTAAMLLNVYNRQTW